MRIQIRQKIAGKSKCIFWNVQSTVGGPKWTKMDLVRPKWTKMVHLGFANAEIHIVE